MLLRVWIHLLHFPALGLLTLNVYNAAIVYSSPFDRGSHIAVKAKPTCQPSIIHGLPKRVVTINPLD